MNYPHILFAKLLNLGVAIIALSVCICSCGVGQRQASQPINPYDLESPAKSLLPNILTEISGITFSSEHTDTLLAVQDELGLLFHVSPEGSLLAQSVFGKKGDYEGVALLNHRIFVLRSDGTIFLLGVPRGKPSSTEIIEGLLPKGEYEGICGDSLTNTLTVLCKNCKVDKGAEQVTAYTIPVDFSDGIVQISQPISQKIDLHVPASEKRWFNKPFQPSAIARHPVSGEWYMVSSINLSLVVADSNWIIRQVYPLKRSVFNQPEGLAFDKVGNLYISNEGDKKRKGNILMFEQNNMEQ
ncbi:uncharacterized protein YjiK [Dyadobacter jejuensis]|uniref:Uncharacterized protein YjiK n=1 Tax=Dyadobacter jejuensis TaxID=1082580 RepID=A0A316AM88_9BACT|nr:SdiA-regulated domain-containing protein [Dyadobacter jejuensis]PWJ58174.1 uncharacterized protein YjiK [Dyadobacter jejuensis]